MAYLRVIHDGNELMFLRIINKPSRKIGEVTIEKLLNFAKSKNLDLYTAIENNFDAIQGKLGISSLTMQKIADLINAIRW
ncbi:ATP-dependent DNA helicase pcrA, partial [Metamycoplasma alkalescens]